VGKSVLIIVENLPVPFDRRVWMEARTLREAGYEVAVICPTGKGYEALREEIARIQIYRHALPAEKPGWSGYFREYAVALFAEWRLARQAWRDRRFNVIHACNPPDLIFLVGWWFKLFHGVKFIFDQHDLNPELYESKFQRRDFFYHALRWAERLTFATADTVISTNESYREVAIGRGRKNPGDVFVVRSAPNLSAFQPVAPNPKYKRGRQHLVGYLGVMGPQDGLDHLLEVARRLPHVQFCLIGSGPMFETLNQMAKNLDNVEFTGRIPDGEVIERLSSCDVCVNPDPSNPLNDKSTMNKILEYMALGRPIVQYDLLEGRRSAGDASWYAKPNDIQDLAGKTEQLLNDSAARERMGQIGRQRMIDELEWRHQAPKLLAAYAKTLA
jgi:glycosyltransferase involved in cell wall biosynthesis